MAILAYLRVSTVLQDVDNQKLEILEFARRNALVIDDFVDVEISSRKSLKDRRIEEVITRLQRGDTLIVTELSRLGRSTVEVVDLVNGLVKSGVGLIVIKQGLRILHGSGELDMQSKVVVTMFSLFSELERDLLSSRTKHALASKKAAGIRLGKPKGTIQKSRLDGREQQVRELMRHKVSLSAISRVLGCGRTTLENFVKSRKLAA
jgi:DNA invertase Pin-like site-specific DNA recombinase